jgi:hypothetical protein
MHTQLEMNAKFYLLMCACVKFQSRILFAMVSTKLCLLGTWLNEIDSNEHQKLNSHILSKKARVTHVIKLVQLHDEKLGIRTNMKVMNTTIKDIRFQTNHNIIFNQVIGGRFNVNATRVDKGMCGGKEEPSFQG